MNGTFQTGVTELVGRTVVCEQHTARPETLPLPTIECTHQRTTNKIPTGAARGGGSRHHAVEAHIPDTQWKRHGDAEHCIHYDENRGRD